MPELPEVEVLKRSLEPVLVGCQIEDLRIDQASLRERVDRRALERRCVGREVVEIGRRAKYLMIGLDGPDVLIVHLGMSGRLTISGQSAAPDPHEHLSFGLSGGKRLRFRDPRRFGLVMVRSRARLDRDRHFAHLGREPLEPSIDGAFLARSAIGRRAPVKSFLMDGRIVVGVGNIYACEALYRAGVHPQRKVNRISPPRWGKLARSVVRVLEDAIEQGGTTLNDFADGEGNPGYFQVALSAYDQEGRPCGRCGNMIRRIVQSGRSTFYCPGCQR